jgi:hypothetical protein
VSVEHQNVRSTTLKLVGEALLAAALVVGLGLGGMKLAQARHARPIRADASGTVHLTVRDSDWHGQTRFIEIDKYDGAWACEGRWEVTWLLAVDTAGRYRIDVELTCPGPQSGGQFAVDIGGNVLRSTVPDTGGWLNWMTVSLGPVTLEPGSHRLVVRPADPATGAAMCLRSVTVVPAAP